jgi:threonine dehydratase
VLPLTGEPRVTPLRTIDLPGWSRVSLKDETKQISGAFKYRGNFVRLADMPKGTRLKAASTGNHAAGLALAAAHYGLSLSVFVPASTPHVKREAICRAGAQLVLVVGSYDDCEREARSQLVDALLIHSFDDALIIAGHRTLFREAAAQQAIPEVTFVPVGGGGLVTAAIAEWGETPTRIIGVEYSGAPALAESLRCGRRVTLRSASGLPEGLLVRRIGERAFDECGRYGLQVVRVDNDELRQAMRVVWQQCGIRAEPSGAAATAAAMKVAGEGRTALCVVSGGNVNPDDFERLVGADGVR